MRLDSIFAHRRLVSHVLALATVGRLLPEPAAHAARGAAELDAEFYLRGLLGQPTAPAVKMVPLPEPRQLQAQVVCPLLAAVSASLEDVLACSAREVQERAAARRPGLAIEYERAMVSGAFGPAYDTRGGVTFGPGVCAPASEGAAVGQFEFELTLYCLFSLLADARLPPTELAAWYAKLGDRLLDRSDGLLDAARRPLAPGAPSSSSSSPPPPPPPSAGSAAPSLAQVETALRARLEQLRKAGYLAGYALDASDADEALWALANDLSLTRLTLTLADPASLRAALQLNAATGGRVAPGLAVPLLLAQLRALGVRVAKTPTQYFMDDEYKPNPLEYRPSSLVVELELSPVLPTAKTAPTT